jgi:hypothetical protein
MTILRRNVLEIMNESNRGIVNELSTNDANNVLNQIKQAVQLRTGIRPTITLSEVTTMYRYHFNRSTKIRADVTSQQAAIQKTILELTDLHVGEIEQTKYHNSISYLDSIETTRTGNFNSIKGAIRTKRNPSGVSGGVRLF